CPPAGNGRQTEAINALARMERAIRFMLSSWRSMNGAVRDVRALDAAGGDVWAACPGGVGFAQQKPAGAACKAGMPGGLGGPRPDERPRYGTGPAAAM